MNTWNLRGTIGAGARCFEKRRSVVRFASDNAATAMAVVCLLRRDRSGPEATKRINEQRSKGSSYCVVQRRKRLGRGYNRARTLGATSGVAICQTVAVL